MKHSVHVFERLSALCESEDWAAKGISKPQKESIAICGLLHDLCKANFYKASTRNVKNEATGQWGEGAVLHCRGPVSPTATVKKAFI